jgi:hypothetical protein
VLDKPGPAIDGGPTGRDLGGLGPRREAKPSRPPAKPHAPDPEPEDELESEDAELLEQELRHPHRSW